MKRVFILLLLGVIGPRISYAATGDVVVNCTFDGAGSTPAQVVANCGMKSNGLGSGTIVANGYDGKKAIKFYYPNNGEVYDPFWTPNFNKPEVTVVYWERFDVDPGASGIWNVKSSRAYSNEAGGGDFIGGMMSLWTGEMFQQGNFGSGTLTVTSAVTDVANWSGYCTLRSGSVWNCPNGRASVNWKPGFGTAWHKVRIHYKAPSSVSAADGVTTFWMDDNLVYTLTNITGLSTWKPYISYMVFHPSDDFFQGISGAKFTFNHFYDDITIYEGYVPPQFTPASSSSAPPPVQQLRVISN